MRRMWVWMIVGLAASVVWAAERPPLEFSDTRVAGARGDFLRVRHLVLRGDNFSIGQKLGEIARKELSLVKAPSSDLEVVAAERRYFERNYPIHLARMRGAARAYGASLDESPVDFAGLYYHTGLPGCSVVYYPPAFTDVGHGMLSRNFDFTTGNLFKAAPNTVLPAVASRPFVIEMYPDQGYPSLYLCLFDLLSGAVDGVNSKGLVVGMMADDETPKRYGAEPTLRAAVGLNEVQVLRYLLDTCADCGEAHQALLAVKHYYGIVPCHYIVADRAGRSFVWEYSPRGNKEYFVEGKGKPQVATNFLLYRHPSADEMPADRAPGMYWRYRALCDQLTGQDKFSADQMKTTHRCAAVETDTIGRPGSLDRTLWHALYDAENCSLSITFYLGEEKDPEHPGKLRTRHSGYLDFQLEK